jgi:hypothetical protein
MDEVVLLVATPQVFPPDAATISYGGAAATLQPIGGGADDRVPLQTAIDACSAAGTDFVGNGTYLVSSPGVVWNSNTRSLNPNSRFTVSPHSSWTPPLASANDPSIYLTSFAGTIAGSGTVLARIYRANDGFIEVQNASLLGLVGDGTDVIAVRSPLGSSGDWNGESGSIRDDVVGVSRVDGNFLILQRPLYCMHDGAATVKKLTTPRQRRSIKGMRLDASGGSHPVLMRVDAVIDTEFDIEVRGASHAAVRVGTGSARLFGQILGDGECNKILEVQGCHDSEGLHVYSSGRGLRCHRRGWIGALVHADERNVRGPFKGHRLKHGVTGMLLRGTINSTISDCDVDDMDARDRVERPIPLIFSVGLPSTINLFPISANDGVEAREGDRCMVKSAGAYPAISGGGALAPQTVYRMRDVATAACKLALTRGGAAIVFSNTGASFGSMVMAKYLVEATGSTLLCGGHDFETGYGLRFTSFSSLALPIGLSSGPIYYATNVVPGVSFQVATTPANAAAGIAVALSGPGDGFTMVDRCRYEDNTTLSRTGIVRVVGAGIEVSDGNPSGPGPGPRRNLALTIENTTVNCCKVPDVYGNQMSVLIVDTVNFNTTNLKVTNLGRTEVLTTPPPDGHIFGVGFWDNYACVHVGMKLYGIEQGLLFLGGWNIHAFHGLVANARDGQSNPGWFIRNGMCESALEPVDFDVEFSSCEVGGYIKLISAHLSTYFAVSEAYYSRFRANQFRIGALDKQPTTYNDVVCAKNLSGGARLYGDVSVLGEYTFTGIGYPKATSPTSGDPEVGAVWLYDGTGGYVANEFGFLATGNTIVTARTAQAFASGAKVYIENGAVDVTTTPGGATFGIVKTSKLAATAGKIAIRRR